MFGPISRVAELDIHSAVSTFFGRVAHGTTVTHAAQLVGETASIELPHSYTFGLDLLEFDHCGSE